jgi:hypothetical protein
MGYELLVDVRSLMSEPCPQFVNLGLPAGDLDHVNARIRSIWSDAPDGWTYNLSALADGSGRRGDHLAALVDLVAKFPVLTNDRPFIRRALLDGECQRARAGHQRAPTTCTPLQVDTKMFHGRRRSDVHLIPGTAHVAASKPPEALAIVLDWLPAQLAG